MDKEINIDSDFYRTLVISNIDGEVRGLNEELFFVTNLPSPSIFDIPCSIFDIPSSFSLDIQYSLLDIRYSLSCGFP